MNQVYLTGRKFYIASVSGFLQNGVRIVIFRFQMIGILSLIRLSRYTGHNRILRIFFIWSPDISGASHCNTVIVSCAAFCAHNVIIFSSFSQMRSFDATSVCAASPDSFRISYNFFFGRIIFYHADRAWFFVSFSCLPLQGNNVFLSVCIMEHGSVKT